MLSGQAEEEEEEEDDVSHFMAKPKATSFSPQGKESKRKA
jgi:hypothetical protein